MLTAASLLVTPAAVAATSQLSTPSTEPLAVASSAAATLPEIQMTCLDGQIDLNHAPVAVLATELDVDTPVAERIAGYRPYLAVSDLLVVEGIGQDRLQAIEASGKACVTSVSTPPPADNACAETDQVDLQSSTATEISMRTGVNKNAAARIVDARPFASLRHVTPERVPGVGKGTLERVVALSCLTPQPIRDANTSWRWGYPAYETTVTRDGYQMTAPRGVIDASSGAWLSITPLPTTLSGPEYPRADFHIHGPWEGPSANGTGADTVLVTLPSASFADDFDPVEWAPYLKHTTPVIGPLGGENVWSPDVVSVAPGTGAVTGHLTTLSTVEWGVRQLNYLLEPSAAVLFGNRFTAPTCASPWVQRAGTASYDSPSGARADLNGALLDLPGNPVPPAGFLIKHCVENGAGTSGYGGQNDVSVRLKNNTGTVQLLRKYGGDVTVAASPPSGLDLISLFVTTVNTGGNIYIAPGDEATATVPAGASGTAQMQPDRLRSLLKVGLDKVLAKFFDIAGADKFNADPQIHERFAQVVSCIYEGFNAAVGADGYANTSGSISRAAYGCLDYETIRADFEGWQRRALASGVINGADAVKIQKGLTALRETVKWLEFGQITVDVSDALVWGSLTDVPLIIDHYAAKPTRDSMGRIVKRECLRPFGFEWRIDVTCQDAAYTQQTTPTGGGGATGMPLGKMIRDTDGHAFLVTAEDQKMHPIQDGGTYICLSRHYAIDWAVDSDDLRAYRDASGPNGTAATCDGSVPESRRITSDSAPDLFAVLRIDDGPESWIVHGGYRYPIDTGGEFNCWVNPQYRANIEVDVYDFVTPLQLQTWPVGNGSISNCGDPENPAF